MTARPTPRLCPLRSHWCTRWQVRLSLSLSLRLSVCLSVCFSVCLCVSLSLHLSVCVSAAKPITPVRALAEDLRNNQTWHECLSSADGHGLAAPGFLSWDTLGASLIEHVRAGTDPFAL